MKPKFIPHECESECNCKVCKDYVNKLDEHRQSISRGELKSKKLLTLSRTSSSKITRQGKRSFELPKPRLVRPLNL